MNPFAVVVGANINGLGVVRSLGQGGVPVIVADTERWQPALHSRYATKVHLLRALEGSALVDDLRRLGDSLPDRPMLFITADWTARTVSEHRERVALRYRLRLPERRGVDLLLNKVRFQQFAEAHRLPVPRALAIHDERDFAGLAAVRFPAIIKPCTTDHVEHHKIPRACRVSSREEAEQVCRALLQVVRDDLIVQEWIDGPDSEIYFCLQYRGERGVTVSSFTGRKLRSWPPHTGSTASCTVATPEVAQELESLTTRAFDLVGVEGMCALEFKRDMRSRRFVIVEPTIGRTDWQEEIATFYGVNIPVAACHYEFGLPVAQTAVHRPVVWRESLGYWRSRWATRSLRDPTSRGAVVKSTWWRRDDPAPGLFFLFELFVRLSRKARRGGEGNVADARILVGSK